MKKLVRFVLCVAMFFSFFAAGNVVSKSSIGGIALAVIGLILAGACSILREIGEAGIFEDIPGGVGFKILETLKTENEYEEPTHVVVVRNMNDATIHTYLLETPPTSGFLKKKGQLVPLGEDENEEELVAT